MKNIKKSMKKTEVFDMNENKIKLELEAKNGFENITENEKKEVFDFCEDYRKFISLCKTEREFALEAKKILEENGFVSIDDVSSLKSGDKVFKINRGKGVFAAVIGKGDITDGVNILGAHIDSPRLDLKPRPLYEDSGFSFFKTQYYGGIKKYQWHTIPLSIHGVVVKRDGTQIEIKIGEDEKDPVFVISDLLPHLSQEQMTKKLNAAFSGEGLNVILGNIPDSDEDAKEKVKYAVLKLLNEKYDITEADLISSEIEIVPAYPARDLGLDKSMILGYGHDDRVCAYPSLMALCECSNPSKTAVCLLCDKEEIGSMGNTGMQSEFFQLVMAKIIKLSKGSYDELMLKECFSNSTCLSSDVGVAYDPNYPETCEKRNTAFMNNGILLTKYTGSRGKSGSSDASAELVAKVRNIFDENDVLWQIGELGKVDLGGGGTIAQFVANLNIDVIDCGVPLLSMHAPLEVAGKFDIYSAFKGYKAFLKSL